MNIRSEILRYMGHKGEADNQLEELVTSCLEKFIPVCTPRHVIILLPCTVKEDCVLIDTLSINSADLTAHLSGCTQAYIFAATLGTAVDRLIAQRTKVDSAEALCLQACAAALIEDYCNGILELLSHEAEEQGLYLCPRFSPGYGDFDIVHQTDILRLLEAHKRIGLSETKAHMLAPLKSVTAIIGAGERTAVHAAHKCNCCCNRDCAFQMEKGPDQ